MFNFDNFEWNITMLALHETVKVWPIWTGALTFMLTVDQLLAYLIFVISFTRANFLENEIYTEIRVNYKKRILLQNCIRHTVR